MRSLPWRGWPIDKKMLVLVLVSFAGLCIFRAIDYWVTGFYVSDEFGYYHDAITGSIYGYRWFFGAMNIVLFRLLGITNATQYWFFLPFYDFLWASVTTITFYMLLKELGFDERTRALSLFSSLFLVSYVLLSLGFLTEPVGLSFAMVGIYFMVRWLKREPEGPRFILYPLIAALAFVAAAGTREPYEIFEVGGILIVPLVIAVKRKQLLHISASTRRALLVASAFAFILPTLFFLQYPNSTLTGQVAPTATDLAGGIVQPTTQATTTSVSTAYNVTVTHTVTVTSTSTVTLPGGGLYVTTTTVTSTTTTVTSTQSVSPPSPQPNPIARTRFGNTLLIYAGGLVLGWGPLLLVVGIAGFFSFLLSVRRFGGVGWLAWLLALFAFGSYFVVSYIFSTDPFYMSFHNYSTIIRFSDTALPAFFLTAPFALYVFAKNRKRTLALAIVLMLFIVAAVPIYETYAASSMTSYTGTNPFGFGFRTDAAQIRDYISSNPAGAPYNIMGYPTGWDFTPGTTLLSTTHVYNVAPGTPIPYLSYDAFVAMHWNTFYIYFNSNPSDFKANEPYLLPIVVPGTTSTNSSYPFTVANRQVVLQGPDFSLIRVQLNWQA